MLRVSVMPLLNTMESRTVRLLGTSSDGVPLGAAAESHHDVDVGGGGGGGVGGGGGREAPATARVRHETVSAVSTCASERSVSPPALRPTLTIVGVRVVSVGQAVPKAVNQPRFVSYSRWVGEDGRNAQHRRDPR